jgi:cytochrome c oxidase cbb3-type subunit 3
MKNDNQKDLLRPVEVDGIQEFDNQLPRWWVWLFWITTIVGVVYAVNLHFAGGESLIQSYDLGLEEQKNLLNASASSDPNGNAAGESSLGGWAIDDPSAIAAGKEAYAVNCIACHADDGGGGIGPNLTDKNWIHGGKPEEIVKVIGEGVAEKGMVSWKPILGDAKVRELASYVWSLQGTTPKNPKAPEGDLRE